MAARCAALRERGFERFLGPIVSAAVAAALGVPQATALALDAGDARSAPLAAVAPADAPRPRQAADELAAGRDTQAAGRRRADCAGVASAIPPHRPGSTGGADFLRRIAALGEHERDRAIRDELLAGNVPAFLRAAVPVRLEAGGSLASARPALTVTLCVLADYLSVGSNADHVLVPMSLPSALAVARAFGFVLPTRHIVDAIYAQASVHLAPLPLPPGDLMRSAAYLLRHDALVRAQRDATAAPLSALVAGHKKDLVLSNRLWQVPGRVAIYGWHRAASAPIQPLSVVHGERYADYSHGVRLVSATAFVDGRPTPVVDLLRDPRLSRLLSDEGPIARAGEMPPGAPLAGSSPAGLNHSY